jgi:hypothetical protein
MKKLLLITALILPFLASASENSQQEVSDVDRALTASLACLVSGGIAEIPSSALNIHKDRINLLMEEDLRMDMIFIQGQIEGTLRGIAIGTGLPPQQIAKEFYHKNGCSSVDM